jgi:DNA helicase HerA-like ATPase
MAASIQIKNSERVAFIGATGTGKTVLEKYFLAGLNRVVVIDPKHTFKLAGFREGWKLPYFKSDFKIVVRPLGAEDYRLAGLLGELWGMGHVTIACDETATLAEGFPESVAVLGEIARTGRERRVALWSVMQRPRKIPLVFLTETETFFIFSLRSRDDREAVRGYVGDEVLTRLPKYYFWYYRTDEEFPRLLTYNLDRKQIEEANLSQEVEENES